jgi:hypothetical protein
MIFAVVAAVAMKILLLMLLMIAIVVVVTRNGMRASMMTRITLHTVAAAATNSDAAWY